MTATNPIRPVGYSPLARILHWLTVLTLAAQFAVGYLMDAGGSGRGRGRGRSGESGRGRGRGGDLEPFGDNRMLTLHVVLGVSILALTIVRLLWRRRSTLPPWAPQLSNAERVWAHWTERLLYLCLFAIPSTGLWLVFANDDVLAAHVASHIVFFIALAAHLGLILKHQLIERDHLLRRML